MTNACNEPVAFGPRAIEVMESLGLGRANVALNRIRELSLATAGEAWPRAVGKGGGSNLTPVTSRHIISLLFSVLGCGDHGGVAGAYWNLRGLAEPFGDRMQLLPVHAEMFARSVNGTDDTLKVFAEDGFWLKVRCGGTWAGVYEDAIEGLPRGAAVVEFTPGGEPDDVNSLAITRSRGVPFRVIHDLALGVREHGMGRKPLRLAAA